MTLGMVGEVSYPTPNFFLGTEVMAPKNLHQTQSQTKPKTAPKRKPDERPEENKMKCTEGGQ